MREVHAPQCNVTVTGVVDNHPVDYHSDAIWNAHVALMLEGARHVTDVPVDAVFTSETYGEELARRLGAVNVMVDACRELVPMSATRVRADPVGCWDFLAAPVRAGLARKVVIVGAESTGKTTLAAQLCERLRQSGGALGLTRWVPEYGRDYTVDLLARSRARAQLEGRPLPSLEELAWPSSGFVDIAREQNRREDEEARVGGPVVVCDTDAFATGIWHERYVGHRQPDVETAARRHDLYLLTHPDDVPFVQDGLRDGQHIRAWMTDQFVRRLEETGRRWQWVRGSREDRVQIAVEAVNRLLATGWQLSPPLG